jgi:hypothetical protein
LIADALALAARGADSQRRSLDRIAGPWGMAARAAARELEQASSGERARRLAAVRAPMPPGLRGVHPSWIEHALADLPARARRALAEGPRDGVDVWLVRWACSELPALPALRAHDRLSAPPFGGAAQSGEARPCECREVRRPEDLLVLAGDALARWLERVGHDQLAYAASLAHAEARRRDELGPARSVIARCRGGEPAIIAARCLAPHLAGAPLVARQLAVKLPRERGLAVEHELAAHAADPLADAPTWTALVAIGGAAG